MQKLFNIARNIAACATLAGSIVLQSATAQTSHPPTAATVRSGPDWHRDEQSGCSIYFSEYLGWTNWSGACEDGAASGLGILHGGGTHDEVVISGNFVNGVMAGQGDITLPDGTHYEGVFAEGRLVQGVKTWPGSGRYEGEFKDLVFEGKGIAIWPDDTIYAGSFRDGLENGHGVSTTLLDDLKLEGEFSNGMIAGNAILTKSDGRQTRGLVAPAKIDPQFPLLRPDYPTIALRLNQQGETWIRFTVDKEGKVSSPWVVKSSEYNSFNDAALSTIWQWRMKPATFNGKPLPLEVTKVVKYRILVPIGWVPNSPPPVTSVEIIDPKPPSP